MQQHLLNQSTQGNMAAGPMTFASDPADVMRRAASVRSQVIMDINIGNFMGERVYRNDAAAANDDDDVEATRRKQRQDTVDAWIDETLSETGTMVLDEEEDDESKKRMTRRDDKEYVRVARTEDSPGIVSIRDDKSEAEA